MTRIYISGPMTGVDNLNRDSFYSAAAQLWAAGFDIVNPCEILKTPGLPWVDYLRADIRELCQCDGVALLDGWQNSDGAQLEQFVAHRLKMEIRPLSDWLRR